MLSPPIVTPAAMAFARTSPPSYTSELLPNPVR